MENIEWYNKAKLSFLNDGKGHEVDVIGGNITTTITPSGRQEILLRSGNFIPSSESVLLRPGIECSLVYPAGSEEKTVRFKIVDWVPGTQQAQLGILSGFLIIQEL
jgi:hypothetical protein